MPPIQCATPRCNDVRQLQAPSVRFVCFGDVHMAFRAIDRLGPVLRDADCAILTGDITNFGDPPDAFRVVNAVKQFCPNVLAVTGNLDMPWVIDAFHAEGISLHGTGHTFGSLGVFGCGGRICGLRIGAGVWVGTGRGGRRGPIGDGYVNTGALSVTGR